MSQNENGVVRASRNVVESRCDAVSSCGATRLQRSVANTCLLLLTFFLSIVAHADDWPQYRGPDLPAGKELRRWQATQWISSLGISPDGKTVAASQHTPFIRFKQGLEAFVPHFHFWDAEGEHLDDIGFEVHLRVLPFAIKVPHMVMSKPTSPRDEVERHVIPLPILPQRETSLLKQFIRIRPIGHE